MSCSAHKIKYLVDTLKATCPAFITFKTMSVKSINTMSFSFYQTYFFKPKMKFYHSGNYLNAEKKDGRQSKHVLQIITKLTAKKKKSTPVQSEEKKTDQVNQTRTEDQHSIISERYESNHQMKCSMLIYFSIRICSHYQFFGGGGNRSKSSIDYGQRSTFFSKSIYVFSFLIQETTVWGPFGRLVLCVPFTC